MNNEDRYKKLTLLHSNDMHGDFLAEEVDNKLVGGVSMLSGYISKVKSEEENVLYCIAGDMFRGSVIDSESRGFSTIEIVNMLAPDVVTIGNHETDYGLPHLLFIEKCAKFPIINANLIIKMNGARLFKPYHIIEIGGMKVLFIGILTEDIISQTKSDSVIGGLVDVQSAAKEISRICNAFNGIDIDFTVLLTHIGFENDKLLAAELDPALGVDVIIGGHSHTLLEKPEKVNDILIVQAGVGTDQIGRFDIIVDTDTNAVASYTWKCIPITPETCPVDQKMEELISELKNQTDLKYGRIVKRLKCELHHEDRFKQTTLGSFIADIIKRSLNVDLMMITSGSIRSDSLGPIITYKDLIEAFPYEDKIHELNMSGKQLKQMFYYIYREDTWNGVAHEFYQISEGWFIYYDRDNKQITRMDYNGTAVDDERMYKVAFLTYDFLNFEEFFGLTIKDVEANGKARVISTSSTETLYEYLDSDEPLPYYPVEDRFVLIKKES